MTTTTTRTITLTDRPPVRITDADWPTIARAAYDDHDGQVACQANRAWTGYLRVRQHADGRALVYGRATYDSTYQGERGYDYRAGVLLQSPATTEDLVAAIHDVHARIQVERDDWATLADACIADLPAEVL